MNESDMYYPLVQTPVGKVPLIGATMTDQREREIAEKYPVLRERDCQAALRRASRRRPPRVPVCPMPELRHGRYAY